MYGTSISSTVLILFFYPMNNISHKQSSASSQEMSSVSISNSSGIELNRIKRQRFDTSVDKTKQPTSAVYGLGKCNSVDKYTKCYRIGEGTYGMVYCAKHNDTGKVVALKRIILHNEANDGFPITSIREINTLKMCSKHVNCIKLLDIVVNESDTANNIFLVFEYCENDISTILYQHKKTFKESEIKNIMLQIINGILFMHSQWIIHRDIKLTNLLYNNCGVVKIADFGLTRFITHPIHSTLTRGVVTLWYRSPEVLFGE